MDDLDLLLEEDPIEEFLKTKLKEVQLNNSELKQLRANRNSLLEESEEIHSVKLMRQDVRIETVWQKLCNKKWIIGIEIENDCKHLLQNFNIVLSWDNSQPIVYSQRILQKERIIGDICDRTEISASVQYVVDSLECEPETDTEQISDLYATTEDITGARATVILVSDFPLFKKKLSYCIRGIATFLVKSCRYQVDLPEFEISAKSCFDVPEVTDERSIISLVLSSINKKVLVKLSPSTYPITDLFDNFKKLDLFKERNVYIFQSTISEMNNTIVEKIDTSNCAYMLNVYSPSEIGHNLFLHYLYKTASGITIFPAKYKNIFELYGSGSDFWQCFRNANNRAELIKKVCKIFESKVRLVCSFFFDSPNLDFDNSDTDQITTSDSEKYKEFRLKLCDLEYEADRLYLQILQVENR